MKRNEKMTLKEQIKEAIDIDKVQKCRQEVAKAVIGQQDIIDFMLTAILIGGHAIVDGDPGTAKTWTVQAISRATGIPMTKVQLTGDQTPDQIKGYEIPVPTITVGDMKKQQDEIIEQAQALEGDACLTAESLIQTLIRTGPLKDAQIFLMDEANRGNEETINSFLSVMQEKDFRVGEQIFNVHDLFTILATRNFIERSGVRELGFAFLDRFALSALATDPGTEEEECRIAVMSQSLDELGLEQVCRPADFFKVRQLVKKNPGFDDSHPTVKYIARIIRATRPGNDLLRKIEDQKGHQVEKGISARTTGWFTRAAAVYVYCILNENVVLPEHIRFLAKPMLRHRFVFTNTMPQRSMELAEEFIDELIKKVPVVG